jgi:pyridinium-3,5-bisthiocarboxylic acid mononucleotide nickel chelatase
MTIVYLDCRSGVAGDMLLGALIDAGAPLDAVTARLSTLGLAGWSLEAHETTRGSVRALKAEVTIFDQTPRDWRAIETLLRDAALPERARAWALEAFGSLARAEAKIHSSDPYEVHFHEVGALDAIVDIVGSCVALDLLEPDEIVCSPIALGSGGTTSAHGNLPIPAPAVLEILAARGAPIEEGGTGELATPTGASIVAAICDSFGEIPRMELRRVGYGAGTRERDEPNVVRVLVGDKASDRPGDDSVLLVETNLDDMNPEIVPYVIDELLAAGALDAWVTPITMKKGRPAWTLSVLCEPIHRYHVFEIVFRETTTFGLRLSTLHREVLDREWVEVNVEGLPVRVKIGRRAEDPVSASPEYEDARAVAHATGLPLKEVYARAVAAATQALRSME